jgi:hypothetical protein
MPRLLAVLRPIALGSLISLLVTAAAPRGLGAQRPAMPRVRPDDCGGYCNSVWASCARIRLRSAPSEKASVAAVLDSGLRVNVLAREARTLSPGVVVVRRTFTLVEKRYGPAEPVTPPNAKRWRLRAGDTIYVVDTESDGDSYTDYVWSYRGREATTAKFWFDPESDFAPDPSARARMVAPMDQQWWTHVRGPRGETGWTRGGREWTGTGHYDDPAEKCAR